MIKFWLNRVKSGKCTIDEVPEKYRAEVKALLEEVAE